MNVALIFSILLHAGVLALAVFGLPKLVREELIENRLVVVDVVTVAEVTNAPPPVEKTTPDKTPPPPPDSASQPDRTPPPPPPPAAKPTPPPPPAPKETAKPAPAPAPTQAAKAAPPPEPAPAVKAEPVPVPSTKPEPPKPEPEKPEPIPVEKPEPDVPKPEVPKPEQPEVAKVERVEDQAPAPVPVTRPTPPERPKQVAEKEASKTPEKEEPEKKADNFLNVLKTVQNLKKDAPKPAAESPPSPMPDSKTTARNSSFDPNQKLSVSEMDAIRQQISSCWLVPAGAKNAADLVVEIEVTMNPDRTVRSYKVVDSARMQSDPFFRSAAESAMRALKSPNCSPLQLPPEKYDTWKNFTITFDPKDMLS